MLAIEELRTRLQPSPGSELSQMVIVLGLGLGIRLPPFHTILKAQQSAPVAELPPITDESSVTALVAAARAIAEEQTMLMRQLRVALVDHDRERALDLAAQMCGLEECHEASNCAVARVH